MTDLRDPEKGIMKRMYNLDYVLSCLDRCEHGRHEGETCYGCLPGQVSTGSPLGDVIFAYDVGGMAVYVKDLIRAKTMRAKCTHLADHHSPTKCDICGAPL